MVRITRVYTGTGDEGETSLVDGSRRSKADPRLEAVGTCDELNALLGMCLMEIERLPKHDDGGNRSTVQRVQSITNQALPRIQNELFDLGAELACPPSKLPEGMVVLNDNQASVLVDEMDAWLEQLEPLTSFILPSGQGPEAVIHLTRTVTRRLERTVLRLAESEGSDAVRPLVLVYLNRLSDWFFVFGRWVCLSLGNDESLWMPLGRRGPESGVGASIRKLTQSDLEFDQL
jgi:cob(I)alamin adenosyltransferase